MKALLNLYKYTRGTLAYIIIVGGFSFLFCLLWVTVPEGNKEIVLFSAGYVLGILSMVASYYFGASKDKSDQDQSKIFPKDPPTP
jgi:hypothetical protein